MQKPLLIADLFCGAGGSSTGAMRAVKALGREMILVCVNHWPLAIETHQANHPYARHYIEDIANADPVKLVPEGRLDLLMASPECTHFSRARGGKPVNNQSRMNPWAILTWVTKLDVRTILIENVPEFRDWGPVDANDQPIKEMKGIFFEAWLEAIKRCGYELDYTILNCADYGDATTRRRFFLIARKDRVKIHFPKPTHSKTGEDGLKKWRAAKEIIDWGNPGRSLLEHPWYVKHPLSINTRRRIAAGFKKQGGALAPYFINLLGLDGSEGGSGWPAGFTFNNRAHSTSRDLQKPIHTITASWNGGNGLVEPKIEPFVMANRTNNIPRMMDEPIHTATAEKMGNLDLVRPKIEPFTFASRFDNTPHDVKDPIPSVTNRKLINVVEARLEPVILGQQSKGRSRTPDEPIQTIATKGALSITQTQLVKYYSSKKDTQTIDGPLDTITTKDRFGLVESVIVPTGRGEKVGQKPRIHSLENPVPTLTGIHHLTISNPVIVEVNHEGERKPRSTEEPLKTLTRKRNQGIAQAQAEPSATQEIDPRRLVWIDGVLYKLDILFRMLTNPELAAAHSFNDAERKYEFRGTVAEVTKQIGNSVPCGTAAALVGEILG